MALRIEYYVLSRYCCFVLFLNTGGPVTHLYESLTGNNWSEHGMAKYCSCSIYYQTENEADADEDNEKETKEKDKEQQQQHTTKWKALMVNQVLESPMLSKGNTTTTATSSSTDTTTCDNNDDTNSNDHTQTGAFIWS